MLLSAEQQYKRRLTMTYTHLAQRAQGLACFLAPALSVLAWLLLAAHYGSLLIVSTIMNDSSNQIAWNFVAYWAHLLLIPAFFGLAHLVGQKSPKLAVACAALALLGLGTLISQHKENLDVGVAIRDGFPINWDFFINADSTVVGAPAFGQPTNNETLIEGVCLRNSKIVRCGELGPRVEQLIVGLPIMLYFLANILLGVAVLRSGVLPRWSGVLLIAAALLHFDATGPQPSGLPLLTGFLAALCLLVVYPVAGLRLWRDQLEGSMA
jgi:hypothetical protein